MVSFQNCFIHKSSSRVYKVVWAVSFPRCTVGNNIVGSCCIRLHLTANTDATTRNIAGQQCWKLLRSFVRSLRSHDSDNGEKSGLTIEKNDWHHWLEQLCPWLVRETHIVLPPLCVSFFSLYRARRYDLLGRQCDQVLLSGDQIFTPGRQPGPQDRWLSSLGKSTLMIIRCPSQN